MMNILLRSGTAEVEIAEMGAEAIRFRKLDTGTEYLWNGDKAFWTGRSPVLFPIVCSSNGGVLRIDGAEYPIGNHGFARKMPFVCTASSRSCAVFRLQATPETMASYPFRFALEISYTLNDSTLSIVYSVRNEGPVEMPFQIGTHPGFHCPVGGAGGFSDWEIVFEKEETPERRFVDGSNLLVPDRVETTRLKDGRVLPLTHGLFGEGALVWRSLASRRATLRSASSKAFVTVSFPDFPQLGIWQPKDAPFVCIEPWHGTAEVAGEPLEMKDRDCVAVLAPGTARSFAWRIAIG